MKTVRSITIVIHNTEYQDIIIGAIHKGVEEELAQILYDYFGDIEVVSSDVMTSPTGDRFIEFEISESVLHE